MTRVKTKDGKEESSGFLFDSIFKEHLLTSLTPRLSQFWGVENSFFLVLICHVRFTRVQFSTRCVKYQIIPKRLSATLKIQHKFYFRIFNLLLTG
ncbi:CLUMA_CG019343, isoform A [Clunio marinus]|uniref:CLUMA_CG019343, isoform A n=1 Tax=Clunio marinus TaxID=568069 RepID=A0A1J1J0J0_9DIPT|nr:CLUMA_CG019343, isoform A [Clunio marinus]